MVSFLEIIPNSILCSVDALLQTNKKPDLTFDTLTSSQREKGYFCKLQASKSGLIKARSARQASEEFENAVLFLRLRRPSALIRYENRAFRKRSSDRKNLKTAAFCFSADGKHFQNEAFGKRTHHDNNLISPPKFSSNTAIDAFSNTSGVVRWGLSTSSELRTNGCVK